MTADCSGGPPSLVAPRFEGLADYISVELFSNSNGIQFEITRKRSQSVSNPQNVVPASEAGGSGSLSSLRPKLIVVLGAAM